MTENPKSAGTYKVRITRGEDDLFKAVDVTAELIIKKAGMALLEVPTIGGIIMKRLMLNLLKTSRMWNGILLHKNRRFVRM